MNIFKKIFSKKKRDIYLNISDFEKCTTIDWSRSEIHLIILGRFLEPRNIENSVPAHWDHFLGESSQLTVNRFIDDGLLVSSPLKDKVGEGLGNKAIPSKIALLCYFLTYSYDSNP